jgi:hypothetical protein
LRLTTKPRNNLLVELTLVDRHDYYQAITELPRVAAGTRAADAVRIPLQGMLATRVRFVQTEITGLDLVGQRLLTGPGPIGWRRYRGRAGRRAGRDTARGGRRPRPGARPARRLACRGGPHHLGLLLTAADRQGRQNPF